MNNLEQIFDIFCHRLDAEIATICGDQNATKESTDRAINSIKSSAWHKGYSFNYGCNSKINDLPVYLKFYPEYQFEYEDAVEAGLRCRLDTDLTLSPLKRAFLKLKISHWPPIPFNHDEVTALFDQELEDLRSRGVLIDHLSANATVARQDPADCPCIVGAVFKRAELVAKANVPWQCRYRTHIQRAVRMAAESSALAALDINSTSFKHIKGLDCPWTEQWKIVWQYERYYWQHITGLNPEKYFSIELSNGFISINSKNIDGGHGYLLLHSKHLYNIFNLAKNAFPGSYEAWVNDPYHVGGSNLLLEKKRETPFRYDDDDGLGYSVCEAAPGLYIVADCHPSYGELFFGNKDQDKIQLAAFYKLRASAIDLLNKSQPTELERIQAADRVKLYQITNKLTFMPSSGFCYRCDRDVSKLLIGSSNNFNPTGCPTCGVSWCD